MMSEKLKQLIAGKIVITGDVEMDQLEAEWECIRSLPNPDQVGTQDKYIAWVACDSKLCPVKGLDEFKPCPCATTCEQYAPEF